MSKARAESVRAQKAFEDHMINFEKKKIRDLRVYRKYGIQCRRLFCLDGFIGVHSSSYDFSWKGARALHSRVSERFIY